MKKDLYIIGISGEDMTYIERMLNKREAELVESIINELNTGREGCFMSKFPSEKEIEKLKDEFKKSNMNWYEFSSTNNYLAHTDYVVKNMLESIICK